MACARVLVFSSVLVAVAATALATADDELRSSIMRRQASAQEIHLHMGSHGEMRMQKEADRKASEEVVTQRRQSWGTQQPGEVSYCDTDYQLSQATGTSANSCTEGYQPVRRDEDCEHSAKILNKSLGDFQNSSHFLINEDGTNSGNTNPSVYVKNCFLFNDKVFFNPTDSVQNVTFTGWQGVPICHKQIYKAGNASTKDATTNLVTQVNSEEACTGDYEWIATHAECLWAHDCEWGGMFCEGTDFENDQYQSDHAPKGCYRNEIGCYGYNKKNDAANILPGMKAVCRLKTYNFDPQVHIATPGVSNSSSAGITAADVADGTAHAQVQAETKVDAGSE